VASALAYSAGGIAVVAIFARGLGIDPRELLPRAREALSFARSAITAARSRLRRRSPGEDFGLRP
jgi:hypothetical protein